MSTTGPAIRNFTLAGHAGCGKTALADRILFKTGAVERLGESAKKTSVSDYRPEEQESGHSLFSAPLHCEWNNHKLFFTDTPGSPDFFGEALSALSVADTALIVVDGINGIEVGTSRASKNARELKCPRVFFINSLDRENADFQRILQTLQDAYGKTTCIPITLPVGREADFSSVVHVLRTDDVPDELSAMHEQCRSALMDTVAESDEELMMRYLDGEDLSEEEIASGLHAAILSGDLIPVFAGSAINDIGIEELLNGIVNLFPHPLQCEPPVMKDGELVLSADGTGMGFVFKSIIDPFIGQLTCFRIYSGTFGTNNEIFNVTQGAKERVGGLMHLNGKEQKTIHQAGPGELVAIAKLKSTKINDTLTTQSSKIQFAPIQFPLPAMSYACYATKSGEEDKITTGLHRLADEDPTVRIEREPDTGELLLSGLGDQHLKMIVQRLKSNYKVDIDLRKPKVPYRETITGSGEGKYRHKKQSGGHGQFGEVWLRVEPLPDKDYEFANEVVGGHIPRNFIPAVEKGVVEAMTNGPLALCKVINVKAIVYDGKDHSVDSSEIAFKIAARNAFKEAFLKANPIILEPIMTVQITTPNDYMGDITGDLNSRRGRILGMDSEEGMQLVNAEVPIAEMFNYSSQLRSITQGRGSFSMEFNRYDQVPAHLIEKIQEETNKDAKDEED